MAGFTIIGTNSDGLEAAVGWDEARGFGGDPVLVADIRQKIDDEYWAGLTPEGPFFQASDDNLESAYATARSVFASVEGVEMYGADIPTYAGGVIGDEGEREYGFGPLAGAAVAGRWTPKKHPRWPKGTPGGQGGEFMPLSGSQLKNLLSSKPGPRKPDTKARDIGIKSARNIVNDPSWPRGPRNVTVERHDGKSIHGTPATSWQVKVDGLISSDGPDRERAEKIAEAMREEFRRLEQPGGGPSGEIGWTRGRILSVNSQRDMRPGLMFEHPETKKPVTLKSVSATPEVRDRGGNLRVAGVVTLETVEGDTIRLNQDSTIREVVAAQRWTKGDRVEFVLNTLDAQRGAASPEWMKGTVVRTEGDSVLIDAPGREPRLRSVPFKFVRGAEGETSGGPPVKKPRGMQNRGTPLEQARERVERTRVALEQNRGNPTEQDWADALRRAEAKVAELERTGGPGFEVEIKETRHGIETRETAAGQRHVVIDQETGKVVGIYKTWEQAYEHWKRLEGDPVREFAWASDKHPRWPKGTPKGGKFMTKGEIAALSGKVGGGGGPSSGPSSSGSSAAARRRAEKKVLYLKTHKEAQAIRDQHPGSRIVRYEKGFAVQLRKSGPYVMRDDAQPSAPKVPNPNDPNPIDCGSDVEKAAKLIAEGKAVSLRQPRQVSVLLDRLAEMVAEAEAKGDKAPNYDLCKVTVRGTNLFCTEAKVPLRKLMPQLKAKPTPGSPASKLVPEGEEEADLAKPFLSFLRKKGYKTKKGVEHAAYLKATQNELSGKKVAGMVKAAKAGKFDPATTGGELIVSEDNYIVDGHHRWAALVGLDAQDNRLGNDKTIPVVRVEGMDIIELIFWANKFTEEMGIPRAGV